MDKEFEQCHANLLQSIRQMKAVQACVSPKVKLTAAADSCAKVGRSWNTSTHLLGANLRTVQDWEQGHRQPTGVAQVLLRIAV